MQTTLETSAGDTLDVVPTESADLVPAVKPTRAEALAALGKHSQFVPPEVSAEILDRASEGARFLEDFGPSGGIWFAQGKSHHEAMQLHLAELKANLESLRQENERLKAQLSRGEASPCGFGGGKSEDANKLASLESKTGSPGIARFAAGVKLPESKEVGDLGV